MSDIVCIIPARGGSKNMPRKNLIDFCGAPLISYTIIEAIKSNIFDIVYVATDNQEIADVSMKFGASIIELPDYLTDDVTQATLSCIYACKVICDKKEYKNVMMLQPTSPLRINSDICGAFIKYKNCDSEFLTSAVPIDPHYFHWALTCNNEHSDYYKLFFDDTYMKHRKFLPTVYRPDGSIKIAKIKNLLETKNFFGKKLSIFEIPYERSIHIANAFDLELCEFLCKKRTVQ